MKNKKDQDLLIKIKKLRSFLNNVIKKIENGVNENITKQFYLASFETVEDLSSSIQESFIKNALINENIDIEVFLKGMFKNRNAKFKSKKKRDIESKDHGFEDFQNFMRSNEIESSMIIKRFQSPKFRKFNAEFNYYHDWHSKKTTGYFEDDLLLLDDKYINIIFPGFDRKNPDTFPPKARWINFADKYSSEYLQDLDSPWCFRSALQCYLLPITSKEFEYELKKMEIIGEEAVQLFIEYCSQLGVIEVTDNDITFLKKLLENGEVDE